MRVLLVSQHFSPEITAARFRIESFCRALVDRGHDVHVICAVPNHPEGRVHAGYRDRLLVRRRSGRLRVDYVWVSTTPVKSFRTRLANYGSFAAMASAVGSLAGRPDVVLVTSPPLTVGAVGSLLARRHHVPWVMDVRDLWPKAAVVLGELTNSRAIAAAEALERWLYADADAVVACTKSFREEIREKAPPGQEIDLVYNGTTRQWLDWGRQAVRRDGIGIPGDRFVLAYAGNLGLYHSLETAVEAMGLLDDRFQLLLIGHGPLRDRLEEQAAALPPGRVRFTGLMTPETTAAHLCAADALLVSLDHSLTDVLSSKLFDYCATGVPVIVAADGETRDVVESAGAALTVPPESPEELAGAIRLVAADPALRERLASAGRALAADYLRERQAQVMCSVLESVAARGRLGR